ncbi:MAG: hypothetical protein NTZ59_11675 [Bacteroidetes bacterium]|nr:hypothetical protein [Bacteroidota bacterium]
MLSECLNCPSIWGVGSEEWEDQQCSACGWRVGDAVDDDLPNDDFNDDNYYDDDYEDERNDPNDSRNL